MPGLDVLRQYQKGWLAHDLAAGAVTTAKITGPIKLLDGEVGAPAYAFNNSATTGWYLPTGGVMNYSSEGVLASQLTANQVRVVATGSTTSPGFSFTSDTNSGLYSRGADSVAIATGGIDRIIWDSAGETVVGGVDTDGGGYVKWKKFSGTLTSTANATLTNPGTVLLGAMGTSTLDGGATFAPMVTQLGLTGQGASASIVIRADTASSGPDMAISNLDTTSSNNYTVTMYYQ